MNYYQIFDLPVTPKVDKSNLSKKYFQLQRLYHPDFLQNASESEKELALEKSALINQAYKIFQDELLTLAYFLKEMTVITDEEKYTLSNDFLMEMMEINEDLSEKEPSIIMEKIMQIENKFKKDIIPFLSIHSTNLDDTAMNKLKDYYYKKKYIDRILERLID